MGLIVALSGADALASPQEASPTSRGGDAAVEDAASPPGAGSAAKDAAAPSTGSQPVEASASPPTVDEPAGGRPAALPRDRIEAADAAFRRGGELYARGELEPALREFESAYELLPHAEVLFNVGLVSLELERWARARAAFERYLKDAAGDASPERVALLRKEIEGLKSKTGTLTASFNVAPDELSVDSVEVTDAASPLLLDAGVHELRASKPGFLPLHRTFRLQGNERLHLDLQFASRRQTEAPSPAPPIQPAPKALPPPPDERTPTWVPWTVTGVLAASWATSAALTVKARRDRDAIERPGTPSGQIDDGRDLHLALAVITDVLLVSTLASAGWSAYVTWGRDETSSHGSSSVGVSGGPSVGTVGVGVRGRW